MSWFKKAEPQAPRPARAGAVSVSALLSDKAVLIDGPADKKALLQALVERACEAHALADCEALVRKVLEREEGISTTLDTGLSLPHARLDNLAEFRAAVAISSRGIPDPKQPELKIKVMFLFFSPNKQEAFVQHLQLLRSVASLFRPELIDALTRAGSPKAALELIKTAESK